MMMKLFFFFKSYRSFKGNLKHQMFKSQIQYLIFKHLKVIKMFQNIMKKPELHQQYLTAMFGHFPFEDEAPMEHKPGCRTHSRVLTLYADLEELGTVEVAAE